MIRAAAVALVEMKATALLGLRFIRREAGRPVCPGCSSKGRSRPCRQCGWRVCQDCVNDGLICYMCDGAYPAAEDYYHYGGAEEERRVVGAGEAWQDISLFGPVPWPPK